MGKFFLIFFLAAVIGLGFWQKQAVITLFKNFITSATLKSSNMKLASPAFTNNETIPVKYTCDGEGINPPLAFSDVSGQAESLALIVDDPDAPGNTFTHWVVFHIPTTINTIDENSLPEGAIAGINSANTSGYTSPCPPTGSHRYVFTLYSLDTIVNGDEHMTKQQLMAKMEGHILGTTQLTGIYKRQ